MSRLYQAEEKLIFENRQREKELALANVWTMNSGKAAPTADRTIVFTAKAEAQYIKYVSTK